ncbi:unnamed protein product [Urochloa humidicola]
MSEEKMEEELRHLIDDKWQWKVKKIAEKEFLAAFPNMQILEAFSRSKGCRMGLYNTWATFSMTTRNPKSSSMLQTGWVQLYNIPDCARNVDATTLIAELAGDVVAVDEVSLIKEDLVRVKMQAREIDKIRGFIEIFINGEGFDVRFVPEQPRRPISSHPQPPPPKKPKDDFSEDDEDDLLSEEDDTRRAKGSRRHGRSGSRDHKGNSLGGKQTTSEVPSQERKFSAEKEMVGKGRVLEPIPIAVFDPMVGQVIDAETFCEKRSLNLEADLGDRNR